MKKVFLIMSALCCLLAAPAIRAQNLNEWAPNEISASYGVSLLGSSINTLIDLAGTFSRVAEADAPTIKSGGSRGILNLGYIHHTNRFVGFGANAGFNRMSVNLEDKGQRRILRCGRAQQGEVLLGTEQSRAQDVPLKRGRNGCKGSSKETVEEKERYGNASVRIVIACIH